jgi:hypothetical protein
VNVFWISMLWLITGCTLGVVVMSLAAMAKEVDRQRD